MDRKNNEKGVISIFLSVFLAALVMFTFCLSDSAEVATSVLNAKYEGELAAQSLLAEYDTYLRDEYGLYGLANSGREYYINTLYKYISNGNSIDPETYFRGISSKKIINIDLTRDDPLADLPILTNEITGSMKVILGEAVLEKAYDLVRNMCRSSESNIAYQKYKQACKVISETEEIYSSMQKTIMGVSQGDTRSLVSFNKNIFDTVVRDAKAMASVGLFDKQFNILADWIYSYVEKYHKLNSSAYDDLFKLISAATTMDRLSKELIEYSKTDEGKDYIKLLTDTSEELKRISAIIKGLNIMHHLNDNLDSVSKIYPKVEALRSEIRNADQEGRKVDRDTVEELLTDLEFDQFTDFDLPKKIKDAAPQSTGLDIDDIVEMAEKIAESLFAEKNYPKIDDKFFKSLPSQEMIDRKDDFDLPSFQDGNLDDSSTVSEDKIEKTSGRSIADTVLVNEYIMKYFKHALNVEITRYSFFNAEIEYIIVGDKDESKNREGVKNRLLGVRYLFNLAYLLTDEDKMDFAQETGDAIAAAVSEGMGGPIYTAMIISSWTLGESALDVDDLQRSKKVPLLKNAETWKLDLETGERINSEDSEEQKKGLSYADYLRILLSLEGFNKKLLRIQDIIELNISKYSNARFHLSNIFTKVTCAITYEIDLFVAGSGKYEFISKAEKKYFN